MAWVKTANQGLATLPILGKVDGSQTGYMMVIDNGGPARQREGAIRTYPRVARLCLDGRIRCPGERWGVALPGRDL